MSHGSKSLPANAKALNEPDDALEADPSGEQSAGAGASRRKLLLRLANNHHALSLADQAIVSGTNFATTVLIGRMAWEAELGAYWLGMTLVLLLLSALNSLVSSPLTLFMQRRQGLSQEELGGVALIHCLSLAALASVGFVALGGMLFLGGSTRGVGLVLLALTLLSPMIMLREFARRVSLAKMRFRTVLVVDLIVALLQISALLWIGAGGKLNSVTAFVASGVSCGLAVVMWLAFARREFQFPWGRIWPQWVENWRLGKWILIDQLTVTANMYLLYWLLAFLKDTGATGIYSACVAIVSLANPFVFGMTNVLAPKLAHADGRNDAAGVRRLVWTSSAILAAVVGGYTAILLIWGDEVLAFCYGAQFTGQHGTITTCALAMFAGVMGTSVSHGLWVKQRNDINFRVSLLGMIVTLAIAVPLLDSWGAVAATSGLLAGNALATLLRFVAFIRIDRDVSQGASLDSIETRESQIVEIPMTCSSVSPAIHAGAKMPEPCAFSRESVPGPRVSIGVPVYNGANYLAAALDSLLAQTFDDFEIIIADNASTDQTPAICEQYVARDRRVRYCRAEQNQGLAWNFNRLVAMARGEYFTWAAHDDLRDPDFLRQCVQVLDNDREVVVCHSQSACIDAAGDLLPADRRPEFTSCTTQDMTPRQNTRRTARLLSRHAHRRLEGVLMFTTMCDEVYGLIRAATLKRTGLLRPFFGSDMVLLAELGLRGRIHVLSEVLFFSRGHAEQATFSEGEPETRIPAPPPSDSTKAEKPRRQLRIPRKIRYPLALFGLLATTPLPWRERFCCLGVVLKFGLQPHKWRNVWNEASNAWRRRANRPASRPSTV